MKKLLLVLGLAGVLMAPATQASFDSGVIAMDDSGPIGGYGATIVSGLTSVLGGDGMYGSSVEFSTFCLERNKTFSISPPLYDATTDTAAILGGGGSVGGRDEISIATAYLYSQFRAGAISTTGHSLSDPLQVAIWFLEGEFSADDMYYYSNSQKAKDFVQLATNKGYYATDDANGAFGVVALNLTDKEDRQSQLAIAVPEPSTVIAGALLLLPFGASVLRTVRKNRAA